MLTELQHRFNDWIIEADIFDSRSFIAIGDDIVKRALFICSQNRLRSPTAEQVFSSWPQVETDSAGLGRDASVPLSPEQIAWANIIFAMEKGHGNRLSARFRQYLGGKRVICLDIPDDYDYMQAELIKLLKAKAGPFLRE